MTLITPVILCGGSGTRLWPLSRTGFPKQFLCLTGAESLFQQAARRLGALAGAGWAVSPPLIVRGEKHHSLAAEQLHEANLPLDTALLDSGGQFIEWRVEELGMHLRRQGSGVEEVAISTKAHASTGTAPGDRVVMRIDPRYFGPAEVETLLAAPSKAKEKLGWTPDITAREMCAELGLRPATGQTERPVQKARLRRQRQRGVKA